jgi:hypothetical protein
MDGEAWQNAQQALDNSKIGRLIISFSGFDPELEFQLNASDNLCRRGGVGSNPSLFGGEDGQNGDRSTML